MIGRLVLRQHLEGSRHEDLGKAFKRIERGWFLGGEDFRQELLARVDIAPSPSHFGEMLHEAMEGRAERLLAETLQRIGWSREQVLARNKGDPHKVVIARELRARTTMPLNYAAGLERRAFAHPICASLHSMKSKILLICLFVSACVGDVKAKSAPAPAANSPAANGNASATSQEPRYLLFWSSPDKAGELAERVGMKGDGKTRILGFGLPNPTFELEKQLGDRIRSAFAAARAHDMAVMLHFDFHLAWKNRPDLWNWFDPNKPGYDPNNRYNVEWHGWDGPPNKVRYLNHGVLERMPPNMCFTSKKVRAEVTRIVSKVIGPVLREEIAKLKAEGKEALFAGVLVGLEPGIDDYSQAEPEVAKWIKEDGVPATPLGYRALLDRGFSADHPPEDFHKALAKIIQETIAFWCEQFVDAGILPEKLYPHVAAPAPVETTSAPIWTAFNKYSRPGWTTYPVQVLGEGFEPIYDELEKHGNPA